jgi:hypothetical protein
MEKPQTLSVKDWIIRNLSVKTNTQERIIEAVINHQMTMGREALEKCNSLEFSGFGKFYFYRKKAEKKLERLNIIRDKCTEYLKDETLSEHKRKSYTWKLNQSTEDIETLNKKLQHD